MIENRRTGPYGVFYAALIVCNVIIPQLLWSRRIRRSAFLLFFIALSVNVGMWLERFVIVITSLHRDFLPSSWGMYVPTFWDWSTFVGSIGLFLSLLYLFVRLLPMISMFEVRGILRHPKQSGSSAESQHA
jgi:molybdopterin-containing oxidoreductase family membrane subunit